LEDANLHFVDWLLDTLAGRGVRLVHVGSASELGDPGSDRPVPESFDGRPVGAYATTKAAGTSAVLAAHRAGVDATVARVFNIVGHPPPARRWLPLFWQPPDLPAPCRWPVAGGEACFRG
jgi:nucleoside-diphosphate-sugar epimerase